MVEGLLVKTIILSDIERASDISWVTKIAVLFSCLGVFYANLTLCQAIVGGLIITLSAQLGDLSESLIKRDAGVKDSSDILPGHGGMLDRFDGYIFAIPVAYYYFMNFCYGQNVLVEFFKYLERFINAYF